MRGDEDLSCREASRLLSLACERALTPGEIEALRHHLGECDMCTNFEAQLAFMHEAARRYREG